MADIACVYTLTTPGGTITFNAGGSNQFYVTDVQGLGGARSALRSTMCRSETAVSSTRFTRLLADPCSRACSSSPAPS